MSWLLRRSFYVDCLASLLLMFATTWALAPRKSRLRAVFRADESPQHQHASGIATHRGASSATPQASSSSSSLSSPGSSPAYTGVSVCATRRAAGHPPQVQARPSPTTPDHSATTTQAQAHAQVQARSSPSPIPALRARHPIKPEARSPKPETRARSPALTLDFI